MIKITKNSKLFIWGNSSNVISGGAEVLNMLGAKLKSLGVNCGLFNYGETEGYQQADFYKSLYNINCWSPLDIIDSEDTIVLLPDIMVEGNFRNEFYRQTSNIQYMIWWLSTGFDYKDMTVKTSRRLQFNELKALKDRSLHLCESEMSMRDLLYHGLDNRVPFQHPVNNVFYKSKSDIKKENIVFYNGLKQYNADFIEKNIIPRLPNITFRKTSYDNLLSKEDLCKEYDRAKVFIDFSYFEGREMMPREACLRDCIIFLPDTGNAGTFDDYPIPEYYKNSIYTDPDIICKKIENCVFNYENHIQDMSFMKNKFTLEPMKFEWEIRNVFAPMINESAKR